MADYTITLTATQEADAVLREGETLTRYCQRMVDGPIAISASQIIQKRFDAIGSRQDAMLTIEEAR
jgi:hypothetical protein